MLAEKGVYTIDRNPKTAEYVILKRITGLEGIQLKSRLSPLKNEMAP